MRKILIIIIIILLRFYPNVYGQLDQENFVIKGTVTYLGSALKDVRIQVKKSNTIVYSDENGNYVLQASIGDVLEFTYPKLKRKLFLIEDNKTLFLNIEMDHNI